jgi:Rps23 Pro-64 3,4-dihydroxylase Tpa1-like proline 4-hydroxylase
MADFVLASQLDAEALAARFRKTGRVQIPDFLSPDSARRLLQELQESAAWRLTANREHQVIDFRAEVLAAFGSAEWEKLNKAVTLGGRYGFQFLYETIRLGGDEATGVPRLAAFQQFMSSPRIVGLLNRLTGAEDIVFADAHASRYSAGHFLSSHDDNSPDMGRRAAYVLNLSEDWRVDWGGLLLFQDEHGDIVQGFTPSFNSLSIFAVPQQHSVTWVTPLAATPRYAVTGWFRRRHSEYDELQRQ